MSTSDSNSGLAVEAEGLTKTFNLSWRRGKLLALDQLDLRVKRGEVYGLLGPNGSGKSTTMKLLLGLIKPTAGKIEIFGEPAGTMRAREKVGFLPENPYFPNFLTGREALTYYGGLCNLGGKALRDRASELLKLVGLERSASRPLRTYSKGMLQRIGLAQALLHDPDLLFLDEPTAGVDPVGSREIRDLILALRERGKTIVFSSHLLEQVQEVSDRVGILYLGQKLREGPLDDLLTVRAAVEIRAPALSSGQEEKIRAALQEIGLADFEIRHPKMRLEDFFISVLPSKEDK
jgi:ABC-2 type transport system ATP-binding protein